MGEPFPKRQILDSSKLLKGFANDNFKFDENGRKFSKWLENTVGKGEIASSIEMRVLEHFLAHKTHESRHQITQIALNG